MLSRTISQATITTTSTTSPTLPYLIPPTLGKKTSSNPMSALSKRNHQARKTLSPLPTIARFVTKASLTKAAYSVM